MSNRFSLRAITKNAWIFLLSTLVLTVCGSILAAYFITERVEKETRRIVDRSIPVKDVAWASFVADGTIVRLTGDAPDDASRFRVVEAVAEKINIARIDNQITAPEADFGAPTVTVEIVQNDRISSIIGLLPPEPSPRDLYRALERANPTVNTLNLVDGVNAEVDENWADELAFLADVVRKISNVKLSATPGQARIEAVVRTEEEAEKLRGELAEMAPDHVTLELDISSPRPLILPFVFAVNKDETGISVSECSATDEGEAREMLSAFPEIEEDVIDDCSLGLGAPNEAWGLLIKQLITDVSELENYELSVRDNRVLLRHPEALDVAKLEKVASKIRGGLPPGFGFETEAVIKLKTIDEINAEGQETVLAFLKGKDGMVRISGVVTSDVMKQNLESFAAAKFGSGSIRNEMQLVEGLPADWETNSFAAVNALSMMSTGEISVTPTHIGVSGAVANEEVKASLIELVKKEVQQLEFAYEIEAVGEVEEIVQIDPTLCVEQINTLLIESPVQFEPSSAVIAEKSLANIARVAQILYECRQYGFEIGGHTDSRGGEDLNLRLSEARANSVMDAILSQALEFGALSAKGYGEAQPIASNDTEAGRAQNRRIEIRLIEGNGG